MDFHQSLCGRASCRLAATKGNIMVDGRGLHRTHGLEGRPDTAYVKDRSISFDIFERLYRQRGYLPAFDELPWLENGEGHVAMPALKSRAPYRNRS
jgi:hypothetical protein